MDKTLRKSMRNHKTYALKGIFNNGMSSITDFLSASGWETSYIVF